MNKMVRWVQNYLIIGLPFVVTYLAWAFIQRVRGTGFIEKALREILSWNLMLWFVMLIVFLILLVIFPAAREKTLKRLANLKERDEREQYITGKAARSAYIATLSLMIFLLFMSVFSIKVERYSEKSAVIYNGGNHHSVTMDLGFSFFGDAAMENKSVQPESHGEVVFSSANITPSKPAMILILLCWQLLVFNLTARRELRKGLE